MTLYKEVLRIALEVDSMAEEIGFDTSYLEQAATRVIYEGPNEMAWFYKYLKKVKCLLPEVKKLTQLSIKEIMELCTQYREAVVKLQSSHGQSTMIDVLNHYIDKIEKQMKSDGRYSLTPQDTKYATYLLYILLDFQSYKELTENKQ